MGRTDVGLIGIAALLGALFLADSLSADPADNPPLVLDLTLGAAGCLALYWRARWPVWIASALIPTIVFSSAAMGATAVAMFAVARYRSPRVTFAVVGCHAVVVTTLFVAFARDNALFWPALVTVLALDAAFAASGGLVRAHRLLIASLEDRAREAEAGQRLRVDEARRSERERIAREMHDVLAHRISLLAVHAGALEVRRSAPADERRAAGVVRESAYLALEELREVIGVLRSDSSDQPQPTLADVPALIEQSRLAGARITLDDRRTDRTAGPDGVGRHVYRVVQEGLTNARKHAPHCPVTVTLAGPEPGLSVEICNPVTLGAVATLPGAGTGLVGLRERMDLVGGKLEHGHTATGEFRLYAWLPWRP